MRQLSTRISLIQFNEFVTEDADLHHLVKCQYSQEWYSVQAVVLSYIKFDVKIGRTIKNTWFVPNIAKEEKTPVHPTQRKNGIADISRLCRFFQLLENPLVRISKTSPLFFMTLGKQFYRHRWYI